MVVEHVVHENVDLVVQELDELLVVRLRVHVEEPLQDPEAHLAGRRVSLMAQQEEQLARANNVALEAVLGLEHVPLRCLEVRARRVRGVLHRRSGLFRTRAL